MRTPYPNELMHYGVMGMKWGVRRYQNPDGTLTTEGRLRYGGLERQASRNDARGEKNLTTRTNIRNRIETRYDKKIAKETSKRDAENNKDLYDVREARISALESKKKAKLKDYDAGTKAFQNGYKHYSDISRRYRDVKLKALDDKSFKKSDEYREAAKLYANQVFLTAYGGVDYAVLNYASNILRNNDPDNYKLK